VTAGIQAAGLRIDLDPGKYQSHFTHFADRIWPETNCYLDLWIEILHALDLDPVPAFACTLSADHDGVQWTFVKQAPEDLRRLYGLEVAEDTVWLPLLESLESAPRRGLLHTVEVDSWWLPETAGTAYRADHVKTTICPTRVDRDRRIMWYFHNTGLHELRGEDFDGVLGLSKESVIVLPPYVEQIRRHADRAEPGALAVIAREHLSRRPDRNPIEQLASAVRAAMEWLPDAGMQVFHQWAFANLRQGGATCELAADFAVTLDETFPGAAKAEEHLRAVASNSKSVQFKMARAVTGRKVDVEGTLAHMAESWRTGMDVIASAVD
jgi:hypothetical protein